MGAPSVILEHPNGAKRPLWDPLGGARSVILEHTKERLGGLQYIYGMEHLQVVITLTMDRILEFPSVHPNYFSCYLRIWNPNFKPWTIALQTEGPGTYFTIKC